jgi:hypothetical protein
MVEVTREAQFDVAVADMVIELVLTIATYGTINEDTTTWAV